MDEKIYLALLHSIWISQKKLHFIFRDKQDYKRFFENISYETLSFYKIRSDVITNILEQKQKINKSFIEETLEKRWARIITIHDDEYPKNLKEIANPPFLFYLRGNLKVAPSIAVVWSRKISNYWENAIEKIVAPLSQYFSIVSGGAAGCDTKAHRVTLENAWTTISVVGTGIDIDYPVHNKKLYDDITASGWAVISIFRVWEVGNPYNFPVRNEIVTWLAAWVLVVEAQQKSWSLITAKLALDSGRDLFAVPGDIYKQNSIGCNNIIKAWEAKLVSSAIDILEEYNFSSDIVPEKKKISFSDAIEQEIYNIISVESLNANEIAWKMWKDIAKILKLISILEIKWILRRTLGWKYEIT